MRWNRNKLTSREAAVNTHEYEPLNPPPRNLSEHPFNAPQPKDQNQVPFSWIEYSIFVLLGIAMLWAWNMFLAAASYFHARLAGDPWAQSHSQSAILAVSTLTNLSVITALARIQSSANYPLRINIALLINAVVFLILTASTVLWLDATPGNYLAALLACVAATATATALFQNGAFAFAASFGRPEYTQALMAGQGISGVLPPLTKVLTVLAFPPDEQTSHEGDASAFYYFLAAVIVSLLTLAALAPLARRANRAVGKRITSEEMEAPRTPVRLWVLFQKLHWLCIALCITFTETMFFPVFTAKIVSVQPPGAGPIFQSGAFIPVAFFFWNLGDLTGRMVSALPFSLSHRPFVIFILSILRAGILPLYLLCNIGGRGAVVPSDLFYLLGVQVCFGLTNGWLGSSCMMAAGDWVDEEEREAAGGFMSIWWVMGLTSGSLLSFSIANI